MTVAVAIEVGFEPYHKDPAKDPNPETDCIRMTHVINLA